MKKFYISILLVFLFTLSAFSANREEVNVQDEMKTAVENYNLALKSQNDGLVESAILMVMRVKMMQPELNYKRVLSELDKLTLNGETFVIRNKAFIAGNYLRSYIAYPLNPGANYVDAYHEFTELSESINKQYSMYEAK